MNNDYFGAGNPNSYSHQPEDVTPIGSSTPNYSPTSTSYFDTTSTKTASRPKAQPAQLPQAITPIAERSANTQNYLNDYNKNREQKIRDLYTGQNDANLAGLKSAYDTNLSAAKQYRDEISPQYQNSMNELSSDYERQRRNNNMQAAVNGLSTGAGSQMALGQMNAYQQSQGRLATAENQALDAANQNILDLKTNYQNQIAQATANNNYQLAAALLDEYGAQYDRTMNQAKQLADFGDFSMYASIYGVDAAQQMEKNWALQNPDLAYNMGKMTAQDYFQITGKRPRGYHGSLNGGGNGYSVTGGGSTYGSLLGSKTVLANSAGINSGIHNSRRSGYGYDAEGNRFDTSGAVPIEYYTMKSGGKSAY